MSNRGFLFPPAVPVSVSDISGLGTLATQNGTFSGISSGTNTGDQTTIVGLSGTMAQFDAACSDGNFVYTTDARLTDARAPTAHNQAWSTITTTPTTLSGYGIVDAQPLDDRLTQLVSATGTIVGVLPWLNDSDPGFQFTVFTAAGRALLDDADAAAQRNTLGLGTLATQNGTFSGTSSGTNTGDQTNITGNAATVTTNANLTGPITSVGNATTIADPELAAIAGLTSAADSLPYFTGSGTASLATFTAAGRALVDDADAAAQRVTLGLGTLATQSGTFSGTSSGTNTGDQINITGNAATVTTNANLTGPITSVGNATTIADAELAAIAGLTSAADSLPYFTGSGTAALATFTAAGRALIDDADASAQRTTLGLGTLSTQSGTFSGTSSGTNTGDQTITLTGDVTGSGTGSFTSTIANNAVTLAKFQQIATGSLLGRTTASTGNVEVITVSTGLTFSGGSLSVAYGTSGTTACVGDDSRLSDARTPTAHNQAWSTITSTPTTLAGYNISDAQPLDADLTAIAGLTSAADRLPYFTGSGTAALATFTTAGRALVDDTDAAAQRATLGLGSVENTALSTWSGTTNLVTIGAANATSINKLTITAPATSAVLTIADGKTLTCSNTLTFTGTDASSVAFGTGGTVAYTNTATLSSLASVGTITTGTWNASVVGVSYGGTGTSTVQAANNVSIHGASGVFTSTASFTFDTATGALTLLGVANAAVAQLIVKSAAVTNSATRFVSIQNSGGTELAYIQRVSNTAVNIYANNNISVGNAFTFPGSSLLMYATAAAEGDSGNCYTFTDNSGSTTRQIKASSVIVRATSTGSTLGMIDIAGNLIAKAVGAGLKVATGSNATMGTATLVAGTVVVSTTKVTANSVIQLTGQNSSGTHGELTVSARTAGTSFTITSLSTLDTRSIGWIIIEPA